MSHSIYLNLSAFKYMKHLDMRFKGSVLHNFTFHGHFASFLTSTVCHATFKKSCKSRAQHSTCSPCLQNSYGLIRTCTKTNKLEYNLKITTMTRRPDSTLDQIPMAVIQRLISSMNETLCGCMESKPMSYQILSNDVTFETSPCAI